MFLQELLQKEAKSIRVFYYIQGKQYQQLKESEEKNFHILELATRQSVGGLGRECTQEQVQKIVFRNSQKLDLFWYCLPLCPVPFFKFEDSPLGKLALYLLVYKRHQTFVGFHLFAGIAGFHLTSWRPCWCTLNKRILFGTPIWPPCLLSFVSFGIE